MKIKSIILLLHFIFFSVCGPVLATSQNVGTISIPELINNGKVYFKNGRFEDALAEWNQASSKIQETNDKRSQAEVLLLKAETYFAIGQNNKAISHIEKAIDLAKANKFDDLTDQATISLAMGLTLTDRNAEARELLESSIAEQRKQSRYNAAAISGNNLAMLHAGLGEYDQAIKAFNQAISDAKAAGNNSLIAKTSVNLSRAYFDNGQIDEAKSNIQASAKLVTELEPSHDKAYMHIGLGRLYARFIDDSSNDEAMTYEKLSQAQFEAAIDVAESIQDKRALSFAYGYLGELKENSGKHDEATQNTHAAIHMLQGIDAPEVSYRWQWQEARLLEAENNTSLAINAYKRAIYDLEKIRPFLAAKKSIDQDAFNEQVTGIYMQLADLLLRQVPSAANDDEVESLLVDVRDTVEKLKEAELENYFRDDCVAALKSRTTGIDQLDSNTAALYPIIFDDRVEILLSLPDGIKKFTIPVSRNDLDNEINLFRSRLEKRTTHQYRRNALNLYNWLIKPLEQDLQAQNINTLIFVPDGSLRTIPLTALYDGKEFLVSRYAIAVTPGLTLTDPKPLPRKNVKLLVAGLTEGVQGFPPLPDVQTEVENLNELYSGTILENSDFTQSNVKQELDDTAYSIVHLASHGKFQSDVSNTFLLTYSDKLNMDTLEQYMTKTSYREQPVELLTLSACQTAVGDDRAALGLGGVAVKAGARSAVATLWYINDEASTQLISEFYKNLKDNANSKAMALQKAQLSLINDPRFKHPSYWAPFLLIGNWL